MIALFTLHKPCPGCGALFPDIEGPTHAYIGSSPGCWAVFGEVLAREYSEPIISPHTG